MKILVRRGARTDIPTTGMNAGEILFCTDTNELFIATGATTKVPGVPDLAELGSIGTIATGDLLMIQDVSATAGTVKMKQVTFADFKTALNIPAGSSDEKVAVISGGTAGYIWGTNGSDGVLRMGTGIGWTKDAGNGFVTLKIEFASEAQGDLIYRDTSAWARLAASTAGSVLQTGGAGANPSWTSTIDCGTFT